MKEPLFQGKSEGDQLFAIFKVLGSPTKAEYEEYSMIVPFDSKIFSDFKSHKRQSFKEKFYYMKDYDNLMDLLFKMLEYNPVRRITAVEALKHPFFKDVATKNS